MHEILANSNISTVKADTPDEYRKQFFNAVDDLKEKDLNPILLVDSRVSPEWIWQWIFLSDMPASHPKKKLLPKGIDIEKSDDEDIIKINGARLCIAPINESRTYELNLFNRPQAARKLLFLSFKGDLT